MKNKNIPLRLLLSLCLALLPMPVLAQQQACYNSVIYSASTSGTTQLVAAVAGQSIYICGYMLWAQGTTSVRFVAGTGSSCGSAVSGTPSTGTTGALAGLTPGFALTTQTGKDSPWPVTGFLIDAGTANAVCINTNAAVGVQAQLWYRQQ